MSLQLSENGPPRVLFPSPYAERRSRSSSAGSFSIEHRLRTASPTTEFAALYTNRSPSLEVTYGRSSGDRGSHVPSSVTRSSVPSQNTTGNITRESTPVVDLTQSPPSQPVSLNRQISISPTPSISTISISSTSPPPSNMDNRPRHARPSQRRYVDEHSRRNATSPPSSRPQGVSKRRRLEDSSRNRSQPSQTRPYAYQPHPSIRTSQLLELSDRDSVSQNDGEPEAVDLTEVDGPAELAQALSKQREDAVKAQMDMAKLDGEGGRTNLTSYKCPVCMDTPEDATVTVCGHLFCHKCIIDTLKFSEEQRSEHANGKVKGTCPVCRKPIGRTDSGKGRELVPLELKLMTKAQFSVKSSGKGKGKGPLKRALSTSGSETMDEA